MKAIFELRLKLNLTKKRLLGNESKTMKTIKILQRILEIPGAYNDNYLSRITSLLQILTEFSRMFHGMSLEGSSIHVVVSKHSRNF